MGTPMRPDDLDETTDPIRHRRTLARIEIEDADRPLSLGEKIRRIFRRRPKVVVSPPPSFAAPPESEAAKAVPHPDDLPEIP